MLAVDKESSKDGLRILSFLYSIFLNFDCLKQLMALFLIFYFGVALGAFTVQFSRYTYSMFSQLSSYSRLS